MRKFSHSRLGLTLLLVALLPLGCSSSAKRPNDDSSEASFAEQAAAVRAGKSDAIRVDQGEVTDADLKHLDGLEDHLQRINLSHTHLSDKGLEQVARMRHLKQLRLASDDISDAGLECLKGAKELEHIHLMGKQITDKGLEHLGAMAHLKSLYLDGTQATDEGIAKLVKALPTTHLHFDGGHHREDSHADDHGPEKTAK